MKKPPVDIKKNQIEEQMTMFDRLDEKLKTTNIQDNIESKSRKVEVDMNDFCMEEVPYSEKEEMIIINELYRGLRTKVLDKTTTKKKLVNWYAVLTIKKPNHFCPNITVNDLVEIAKKEGFKVL